MLKFKLCLQPRDNAIIRYVMVANVVIIEMYDWSCQVVSDQPPMTESRLMLIFQF